jgi:F420-dependent methylenetetrahydromethanopterin dehydrogenase
MAEQDCFEGDPAAVDTADAAVKGCLVLKAAEELVDLAAAVGVAVVVAAAAVAAAAAALQLTPKAHHHSHHSHL